MALNLSMEAVSAAAGELWALVRPGGTSYEVHWAGFIGHHGHVVVELALVAMILYLLLQKGQPAGPDSGPLTEKEVDTLCAEWQPEPLCQPLSASEARLVRPPVIEGATGTNARVGGRRVLNLCATNFLGIAGRSEVQAACEDTLNKYGCGSCGPRGFYGTIDVHLQLEAEIARFMGTEEAIIYSYDLATLPSIIPAFANRKDVIICDEGVNYAIQNGCDLSRSRILTFKHNDAADLERIMEMVAAEDKKLKTKLNRKYVVVEGIYANFGDLAPLDRIFALKEKYKYRLIVDESLSLGVLGATGRGACEHFGIHGRAEIVAASMGNSMATIGGFCCGDREICDHQRLSGAGYCFSASLPPFLATAALGALSYMEQGGQDQLEAVRRNAQLMRSKLAGSLTGLQVTGGALDAVSPLIHLCLTQPPASADTATDTLQDVVDGCLAEGVLLSINSVSRLDAARPPPSLRLAVTSEHSAADLSTAAKVLAKVSKRLLASR
mmetsp:Transcript_23946/g.61455  ORF Transcript_23946/g.61455 Transcript_23946/m.61455 type:complete len:496 (+) Transcript_23946:125-1612(+)